MWASFVGEVQWLQEHDCHIVYKFKSNHSDNLPPQFKHKLIS